jgi:hypothetical protein
VESLQFWHDPSSWQMMLETTNIHQKEVKISSEVGKKKFVEQLFSATKMRCSFGGDDLIRSSRMRIRACAKNKGNPQPPTTDHLMPNLLWQGRAGGIKHLCRLRVWTGCNPRPALVSRGWAPSARAILSLNCTFITLFSCKYQKMSRKVRDLCGVCVTFY